MLLIRRLYLDQVGFLLRRPSILESLCIHAFLFELALSQFEKYDFFSIRSNNS